MCLKVLAMVVNYCYSWSSLQNPSFQSGNICRYCLLVVLICIAIQQSQMEMFALGMGSLVSRQCLRIWEHTDFPNQACPPEVLPPLRVGNGCQHPVVHLGMHTVHWCFCATLSTFAHALARSSRIRQSSSKCCFLLESSLCAFVLLDLLVGTIILRLVRPSAK